MLTASSSPARSCRAVSELLIHLGAKAIDAKNWRALERDGLDKTFPRYAAQVAIYQAYLGVTNPALFTALNADTCEHSISSCPSIRARTAVVDRAVTIIKATQASELLPRAYSDPTNWHCRACSHQSRCWR